MRAKRRKAGSTFALYGGAGTPDTIRTREVSAGAVEHPQRYRGRSPGHALERVLIDGLQRLDLARAMGANSARNRRLSGILFQPEKVATIFFDPKHNVDPRLKDAGDYEPHSKRYQELAKLAITLSAAAIAFLISIVASDKPVAPAFALKVQLVAPIVCGFFGSSIALLVLFMVLQSVS